MGPMAGQQQHNGNKENTDENEMLAATSCLHQQMFRSIFTEERMEMVQLRRLRKQIEAPKKSRSKGELQNCFQRQRSVLKNRRKRDDRLLGGEISVWRIFSEICGFVVFWAVATSNIFYVQPDPWGNGRI